MEMMTTSNLYQVLKESTPHNPFFLQFIEQKEKWLITAKYENDKE
jgi:hypothetical protein